MNIFFSNKNKKKSQIENSKLPTKVVGHFEKSEKSFYKNAFYIDFVRNF